MGRKRHMRRGTRTARHWSTPAVFVCVGLAACGTQTDRDDEPGPAEPSARVADLSGRYWEWYLETFPTTATTLGDRRYDDRLRDISAEGRARESAAREAFLAELREIDRDQLAGQDRVTHLALEEGLTSALGQRVCRSPEWVVDHMRGPQVSFMNLVRVQPVETPADGEAMIGRWQAMGPYLATMADNLRAGLADGLVASRPAVEHAITQIEALLEVPDAEWPLAQPGDETREGWSEDEIAAFREGLLEAIEQSVRPGFAVYLEMLQEEVLPVSRPDDQVGLVGLSNGVDCYDARKRAITTLDLSAEAIHEIGLEENARIRREMSEIGERVFGTTDVAEIQRRLRTDPAMHFETSEEVFDKAVEATARATEAMPAYFGRLPQAEVVVEEIAPYEAPFTTIAYYRQPAVDGSRPGTYFINTYAPTTRPRYEAEVLAFHEAIPGHHLQIAIAQELTDIPSFRKHQGATAFVEGWALYTERLSDEMGLYSGDLDRLGVLSFDAWRASRLVVDTGIHAFGWTRQEAIDYMVENTLLAENNVANEVDRYIVWPGQALAYKLGQREILGLRARARETLGEAFDIREFHDRVLENGAVSLSVLGGVIDGWLEEGAQTR